MFMQVMAIFNKIDRVHYINNTTLTGSNHPDRVTPLKTDKLFEDFILGRVLRSLIAGRWFSRHSRWLFFAGC